MFGVYRRGNKPKQWRFECEVSLAGVLADAILSQAQAVKPSRRDAMPWDLSGVATRNAVMAKYGINGAIDDFKLVIDATWGREDALLLEIENVYGYSYEGWTPLMFQLSMAAEIDKRPSGPKTPVEIIRCGECADCDFVHEFLYLQCGHVKGTGRRTWGMMGYTNAALLWPDAFKYLLSKAGFVPVAKTAKAGC